jgi:hypothetical protein
VLADFEAGVKRVTGRLPSQQEPRQMWPALAKNKTFCECSVHVGSCCLRVWQICVDAVCSVGARQRE